MTALNKNPILPNFLHPVDMPVPPFVFAGSKNARMITAADFWCGAGGTSTGLVRAVKKLGYGLSLTALNHWEKAFHSHAHNHPYARHYCKAVDAVNPLKAFPAGFLNLLVASPECVYHSICRNGLPSSEQHRADAWDACRWLEKIYVESFLFENVVQFRNWGPLKENSAPDPNRRGAFFDHFISYLRLLYDVEYRVLNCADFGDYTARQRLFIIGHRRELNKKIVFPSPTHASREFIHKLIKERGEAIGDDGASLQPWRPAGDIIDFSIPSTSVFERAKNGQRPLGDATLRRIFGGLFKYGLESFLVNLKGSSRRCRPLDEPTFTQTGANHQYLCQPFRIADFTDAQNARIASERLSRDDYEGLINSLIEVYKQANSNGFDSGRLPSAESLRDRSLLAAERPFLVRLDEAANSPANAPGDTAVAVAVPQLGSVISVFYRYLQNHELAASMSFPSDYKFFGNEAEQRKQIGNAVPVETSTALCLSMLA
jgi:site-specific DNA-cytosine methylase